MEAIVGYSGFVGSNIICKHKFDALYNRSNIETAFGTKPDLLVYAGVPAEMFLANSNPAADYAIIENAVDNIRRIGPRKLVLISTIAVLDNPVGVDEDCVVDTAKLTAYGLHRYQLEQMAQDTVQKCHIMRLPALFGKNMKKNFIYDLIHFFPVMLNQAKYEQFSTIQPIIADCYTIQDNGFYKLSASDEQKPLLRSAFERFHFSALNFTDSRSVFQFYSLEQLWGHIAIAVQNEIPLLHLAVEPVSAGDVFHEITGKKFVNEFAKTPFNYDYRTKYNALFGGADGYIYNRHQVMSALKQFIGKED